MASVEQQAEDLAAKQAPTVSADLVGGGDSPAPSSSSGGFPVPDMKSLLKGLPSLEQYQQQQQDYDKKLQAAQAPFRTAALNELNSMKEPQMPNEAPPPKAPTDLAYRDSLNVFKDWAPAVAMLGTAFTKRPLINAMKAAGGAMQGFNKGDQQRVDLELKKWQDSMEAWRAEHERVGDMRKWVMDDNRFHADRFEAFAAAAQNPVLLGVVGKDPGEQMRTMLDYEKASSEMIKAMADMKKAQSIGNTALDADTLGMMADQYLAGDKSVMANLGRGTQGAANIVALRGKIAEKAANQGLSGADIARRMMEFSADTAALRSVETTGARVAGYAAEAGKMANQALTANSNLKRAEFVPFNRLEQTAEAQLSSPELIKLKVALMGLKNTWAKAINAGGMPHVGDKSSFDEAIYAAQGPEGLKAGIEQIQQEIKAAEEAPAVAREKVMELSGRNKPGQSIPKEAISKLKKGVRTTFGNGQVWTLDESGQPQQVQ